MREVVLLGRILFSLIFILSGFSHFTEPVINFASNQGVPYASFIVPFSGLLAILGGLSIALGYYAKVGAWLLVAFLVPVTLKMHAFWSVSDPALATVQQVMFMKNIAMLGGAMAFAYFGSGPYSLKTAGLGRDEEDVELELYSTSSAPIETVAGLKRTSETEIGKTAERRDQA